MKKTSENTYQHSATLFRFCKEALEMRYDGNVKVIDQDVGAILGYDPADCSHWKKGKKNIRALSTLRSIADHLSIDEHLLIDIAAGRVGLEEAVFEFKGYGAFNLRGAHLENLKKEFFKNPGKWKNVDKLVTFEELFNINRKSIVRCVASLLKTGGFNEAPIYLPEVYQHFGTITLESDDKLLQPVEAEYTGEGKDLRARIRYRGPEMRPYMRFVIAKELMKFLVHSQNDLLADIKSGPQEVLEVQSNIFAGMLLVPQDLLRKEVENLDSAFDVVQQLADTFWVSKSLMNLRLGDYMENLD